MTYLILTAIVEAVLYALHRNRKTGENETGRIKIRKMRAEPEAHKFMQQNPNYSPRKG